MALYNQFYYVRNRKFVSKLEALEYARRIRSSIKYYYDDNAYSHVNWTIEPLFDLDYYYLERAKQIRDKYDYLILAYSGGYDSTNILETFYYNNLKLDKIITVGAFSQDTAYGSDENHNGELYHNAIPYLKELGLMDITEIIDYTQYFDNFNEFSIFGEKTIESLAAWISPNNWFWRDIDRYAVPPEWRGKRVAIIFGREKPTLYNADYTTDISSDVSSMKYFCFNDKSLTNYGGFNNSSEAEVVNFYWDKDNPEILVKQLHIVYKYLQAQKYIQWNRNLGTQILDKSSINKLIYNLKYNLNFKSPKSPSTIFSLRDNFLAILPKSDVYSQHVLNEKIIRYTVGSQFEKPVFSKLYKFIGE